MINKEKINTLIGEARKSIGELVKYIPKEDNKILSSSEMLGNIKYNFLIAVESCIDICNHISAKIFTQTPESYSHCFKLLGDKNVISRDTAEKMSKFAGFRNLLVHPYWKVDDKQVIAILKNDLNVITGYLEEIINYSKI